MRRNTERGRIDRPSEQQYQQQQPTRTGRPLFLKVKTVGALPLKGQDINFERGWKLRRPSKLHSLNSSTVQPSPSNSFKSPVSGRHIPQGNRFLFEKIEEQGEDEGGERREIELRVQRRCSHLFEIKKRV